jgi:hypothetical protein
MSKLSTLERELVEIARETLCLLREIRHELHARTPIHFTPIQQENTMTPLDPGATGIVFATTTLPTGAVLPEGTQVTWKSSNPKIALSPIADDPTGLSVGVSIDTTAAAGDLFTLTVTAPYTDSLGVAQSPTQSNDFTVGAPPPPPPVDVTGFAAISQTA